MIILEFAKLFYYSMRSKPKDVVEQEIIQYLFLHGESSTNIIFNAIDTFDLSNPKIHTFVALITVYLILEDLEREGYAISRKTVLDGREQVVWKLTNKKFKSTMRKLCSNQELYYV